MEASKLRELLEKLGLDKIREANGNFHSCCPYHQERNPSWGISIEEPHRHGCFTCGAKGTLLDLLIKVGNYSVKKAREICLLNQSKFELPKFSTKVLEPEAIPEELLYPFVFTKKARTILERRGVSRSAAKRARIVHDHIDNRILFPWYVGKKLVAVTARAIEPKGMGVAIPIWGSKKKTYLYLPLRKILPGRFVLVEGEVDALNVLTNSHENVGAVGRGTISKPQIDYIIKSPCSEVCIFSDSDAAGDRLAQDVQRAISFTKRVTRAHYERFKPRYGKLKLDPAELTPEDQRRLLRIDTRDTHWQKFHL